MGCFTHIITIIATMILGLFAAQMPETVRYEPVFDYSEIPQTRTEDGAFVLGYEDAPITIVAFEDFLCPHCQNYQPTIHGFIEAYVMTGQAKFEFRMLPISQMSFVSFGMAECSEELSSGSFWDAHDILFQITSTTRFDESSVRTFANVMDIGYDDILACLETSEQASIDQALASQFDEVTGTPSVGWRLNDGDIRFDIIPRQPTVEQIGELIEFVAQQ